MIPTVIRQAAEAWATVYSNSAALRVGVTFCHFAGLVTGGGLAVATDRSTLRLATGLEAERQAHLDELGAIHRVVVLGLTLTVASGLLMVAADLDTMLASTVFWTKMALVSVLLGNGLLMTRAEHAARTTPVTGWPRLRRTAMLSLILWFLIVLASTILTTAA
jgi:hypothetical protein